MTVYADPGYIASVADDTDRYEAAIINALRDRVVHHFASEIARDAAITIPTEGMMCYTVDTDGLWLYNGVGWCRQGINNYATGATSNQGTFTAETVITGMSVSWTAVLGRRYKVCASGRVTSSVSGDLALARVCTSLGGTIKKSARVLVTGSANLFPYEFQVTESGLSGAQTRIITVQRDTGTGNITHGASSSNPAEMWVEDIGSL